MDMTHETTAEPITDVIGLATGVRLAYRRVGTGEPLLLITATSCS
jgi:hypothetical protein